MQCFYAKILQDYPNIELPPFIDISAKFNSHILQQVIYSF